MAAATSDDVSVHFGRGGAGNIAKHSLKDSQSPSHGADAPSRRREPSGRRFSTGIGGSGNIALARQLDRQNAEDETARLLYDIQAPGIVLVDDGYYTGIGGAANTHRPTEAEINEARGNNEHMRRQSLARINQRRESPAARRKAESPSSSWNSRRMSVAESMKDYLKNRRMSKT